MVPRRTLTLEWTDDDEANRLISDDPLALLIGFCLDQQITVEKAFAGPLVMRQRLGTLDACSLSSIPARRFEDAFRTPPAIHRFPVSMADRVQRLCAIVATDFGGRAERLWMEAADATDVLARLARLPGFGRAKSRLVFAVLVKHYGLTPSGWEAEMPGHPTLGDVTTADERRAYQAAKRAAKAAARAAAASAADGGPAARPRGRRSR